MMSRQGKLYLVLLMLMPSNLFYTQGSFVHRNRRKKSSGHVAHFAGSVGKNIIDIHKNIFSWDSFKIVTLTFPFFVGARMIDEKLQGCFYNKKHHKNINQIPEWCHKVAQWSIAMPIMLLGMQSFLSKDEEFRTTSQLFVVGMPFVFLGKKLIKKFKFDACLRPWNEKFDQGKRSYGGLPSGHVAEATYTAVLYGTRFGYQFAVPLGALAAFVGVTFLACNRHYFSQVIAGIGFGTLYALAANKVVDSRLKDDLSFTVSVNKNGGPSFGVSYLF